MRTEPIPNFVKRRRCSQRKGVAVVLVLLICTLLTTIAIAGFRLCRNERLRLNSEQRSRVAQLSAQSALHRSVALLRRNRNLRGAIVIPRNTLPGGVILSGEVLDGSAGMLEVRGTANYQGTVYTDVMLIDPNRL